MTETHCPSKAHCGRHSEVFGFVLLVLAIIVLVARTQITEALPGHWSNVSRQVDIGFAEVTTTVIFGGVILAAGVLYLFVLALSKGVLWRPTGLVVPLGLFIAAGVVSTAAASNTHNALVGSLTFISFIVLAILLVQWLGRRACQRLLLAAIAAAGVGQAFRCYEQYRYEVPLTQQMFEQDADQLLRNHGFEPGTYQARQFAARITSGDINGYFASSNTAAALFVLSITATLALLAHSRAIGGRRWGDLIVMALAALAQWAALLVTASKGGIATGVVLVVLIVVLWLGRSWLGRHWRLALMTAAVTVVVVGSVVVAYGLKNDRLPSASLWVRWQYWRAGAAMTADHPLTGVGVENFGQYYPRYMDPAAPEVVKDPHCLPVALASEWGFFALAGLIWALVAVALRLARPGAVAVAEDKAGAGETTAGQDAGGASSSDQLKAWQVVAAVIVLAVVLIRFSLSDVSQLTALERSSIVLTSFVVPAMVWLVAFGLLFHVGRCKAAGSDAILLTRRSDGTLIVLGAGLIAFLSHSLIDYAMFEGGVGSVFFALLALALAIKNGQAQGLSQPNRSYLFWIAACLGLVAAAGVWVGIVVPIGRAQHVLTRARNLAGQSHGGMARYNGEALLSRAASLAKHAGRINTLDPAPARFQAECLLALSQMQKAPPNSAPWLGAVAALQETIKRDPARHQAHRQLAEIFADAALRRPEKAQYKRQAIHHSHEALSRYATSSELLVKHAVLLLRFGPALQLAGYRDEARNCLEQALAYEEAFLEQQAQMFAPDQRLPRRLDEHLESVARDELRKLRQDESPPSVPAEP